jgi:hypothetical protein
MVIFMEMEALYLLLERPQSEQNLKYRFLLMPFLAALRLDLKSARSI